MINFFLNLPLPVLNSIRLRRCCRIIAKPVCQRKNDQLRIHTRLDYIERELRQTHEYKAIVEGGLYFPNDPVFNLSKVNYLAFPVRYWLENSFFKSKKCRKQQSFQVV
jgi:hypothetical protein